MYQKMTHTLEDLKKLAAMELRDVNREELVDINDVEIKKDLSQRERMVDLFHRSRTLTAILTGEWS